MKCKIIKYFLNEEKYMFLYLMWILPLIPMLSVLILGLINKYFIWWLLLLLISWSIIFGYLCFKFNYYMILNETDFIVGSFKTRIVYKYSDIIVFEKNKSLNNILKHPIYRIILKDDKSFIINNKKLFNELSLRVKSPIVSKTVFD